MTRRRVDPDPLTFYKDCLGIERRLRIVCDTTFIKWYCLNEGNRASYSLADLLKVEHYELRTTNCVKSHMNNWYEGPNKRKSFKVACRVEEMQNIHGIFCCDGFEVQERVACIQNLLKQPYTRGYFLATLDYDAFKELKKKGVPIITVKDQKLVILPPTRAEKRLLQSVKQKDIELWQRIKKGELTIEEAIIEEYPQYLEMKEVLRRLKEEYSEIEEQVPEGALLEFENQEEHIPDAEVTDDSVLEFEKKEEHILEDEVVEEVLEDAVLEFGKKEENSPEDEVVEEVPEDALLVKNKKNKKGLLLPFKAFNLLNAHMQARNKKTKRL